MYALPIVQKEQLLLTGNLWGPTAGLGWLGTGSKGTWTGVTTAPLKWGFMCMFLGCCGVTGGGVIITLGASIWGGMCTP